MEMKTIKKLKNWTLKVILMILIIGVFSIAPAFVPPALAALVAALPALAALVAALAPVVAVAIAVALAAAKVSART